jgi:hypothetical protein
MCSHTVEKAIVATKKSTEATDTSKMMLSASSSRLGEARNNFPMSVGNALLGPTTSMAEILSAPIWGNVASSRVMLAL